MLITAVAFIIDLQVSAVTLTMVDVYGTHFVGAAHVFAGSGVQELTTFCPSAVEKMSTLMSTINVFNQLILIAGLGFFTSLIQKLTITSLKDNVQLSRGLLIVESAIVIISVMNYLLSAHIPTDNIVSDTCSTVIPLTDLQRSNVDYVYMILGDSADRMSFKLIVSSLVVLYTLIIIIMLQRTQKLGELIMMVGHMVHEFEKFITTFGLLIGLFIIVGMQLSTELKVEETSVFQTVLDIFDGFNGR
jgi:hypothetical protein